MDNRKSNEIATNYLIDHQLDEQPEWDGEYDDANNRHGQAYEFPRMLTGIDYPELCAKCRAAIDTMYAMLESGPDYDRYDDEAAINLVYDNRMYCGGHECINKPGTQELPILPPDAYNDGRLYQLGIRTAADDDAIETDL